MPEGGFFEQKRSSPTSLVVVVAVHAAAIAALALAKIDVQDAFFPKPLTVKHIPLTPDPPPVEIEPIKQRVETRPQHVSVITPPKQEVVTTLKPVRDYDYQEPIKTVWNEGKIAEIAKPKIEALPPPPPPIPIPEPVRTQAKIRAGVELLPPYPASEQRSGTEGSVTVRLIIGPDGRVRSVERVRAASEGFWRATERHALRAWRFSPATVDGRPVESSTVMTVKFRIEDS
ncbi:MAG TPA: TonB family protein [Allosphingosinicella sp.]|jgi:protein TonB